MYPKIWLFPTATSIKYPELSSSFKESSRTSLATLYSDGLNSGVSFNIRNKAVLSKTDMGRSFISIVFPIQSKFDNFFY